MNDMLNVNVINKNAPQTTPKSNPRSPLLQSRRGKASRHLKYLSKLQQATSTQPIRAVGRPTNTLQRGDTTTMINTLMNMHMMSSRELAKVCRVSRGTIYNWKHKGLIPFEKLGGTLLFKRFK